MARKLHGFASAEAMRTEGPPRKDAQTVLARIREWRAEGKASVRQTGGAFYRTMWRYRRGAQ
eukprot:8605550-Lingulodinium_polyedra.AAC.1